jgi:hypothetical protein
MFWGFLLLSTLALGLIKLGALSVSVGILSGALKIAAIAVFVLFVLLVRSVKRNC